MPLLENRRHEKFAKELAKGTPVGEAYVKAGYEVIDTASAQSCGSRLKAQDEVKERVWELQERAAEIAGIKRADILMMLLDDRDLAREVKHASAAIRATELLGKETANMFVDKKEIRAGYLDEVDFGELARLREAIASENARRTIEGSRAGGDGTEDRALLPGPGAIETGALPEASGILQSGE